MKTQTLKIVDGSGRFELAFSLFDNNEGDGRKKVGFTLEIDGEKQGIECRILSAKRLGVRDGRVHFDNPDQFTFTATLVHWAWEALGRKFDTGIGIVYDLRTRTGHATLSQREEAT